MRRKSRKFPDVLSMRIGESFIVKGHLNRIQAWTFANRRNVEVQTSKLENDEYRVTKIAGPVIESQESPIFYPAKSAEECHFKVHGGRESKGGYERKGIGALAAKLDYVYPCDILVYDGIPDYIKPVIEQIISNTSPVDVMHWLHEFYTESETNQILKRALLETKRNRLQFLDSRIETAVDVLNPRWENGIVVVNDARRYVSADVVETIADAFGVDEIYMRVKARSSKEDH